MRFQPIYRKTILVSVLIMSLFAAASGLAGEPDGSVFVDLGAGLSSSARVEHVFGGQSIPLSVVVYGAPNARSSLKGRLFQVTQALAVPLGGDINIASDIEFSSGIRREIKFGLAVPIVKRETDFELPVFVRFRSDGPWRKTGSLRLRVYPADLLRPLRDWTDRQPLRLRDATGKLEAFLKTQGIEYLDLNTRSLQHSNDPGVTLVAGGEDGLALAKREADRGEVVVAFRERVVTIPRVEAKPSGNGSLVTVELEMLDSLPTHPNVQKAFLEIIEMARSQGDWGQGGSK